MKRIYRKERDWLILHGRHVCVAHKPKCPQCLINDLCEYPLKTVKGEGGKGE